MTEEQLNAVSEALLECIYSWNICFDMPELLPVGLKYTLLVDALKNKVVVVSSGFTHLELCNYESASCPFGIEFCRCIESEEDIEFMKSFGKK